jgi:murein DD-endopeptidase MepM/ murein hydrolase activator NlpD
VVKINKDQKKSVIKVDILVSCLLAITLVTGYKKVEQFISKGTDEAVASNKKTEVKFGFDTDKYHLSSFTIAKGELLGEILSENGISGSLIHEISEKAKDVFSVTKIRPGKNYHIVKTDSCSGLPLAVVYEASPVNYVIYDLQNKDVKIVEKPTETCVEMTVGEITSSLWGALESKGINPSIIDKMEDALGTSVDFYHTHQGDKFKVIYEKQYVDGKEIGIGKLIGAHYNDANGDHYAIHYRNGEYDGYYNYKGIASKAAFLMSPLKFARISSGFNMRRFHPIRKITTPHFGTDYAAPYGTPIRAVGDGVVEEATYAGGNGRFVKIRHDKTYQTQYLHMQGFAGGIRKGSRVTQGQTIGYVGSTGLATGPHVCFRFWKNGQQINHLKQKFAQTKALPNSELPTFFEQRDVIKKMLDAVPMPGAGKVGA